MKEKIQKAIDSLSSELIKISRALHAEPELNFKEEKAARLLSGYLAEKGFEVEKNIAGLPTAFRARFQGTSAKPAIAFLAEYDALPKLGHACGHNLIAASSIGAAVGLIQAHPDLPAEILVLGTPAEEGGGGKVIMAKAGAFDGVDAAMMVHPDCRTELVKRTLAMTNITVTFHGKAAHAAATPHQGINALDAVILSFNAIGALRQQITPDARIHGIITDGGQAPNIIPQRAAAVFYVRSLDMHYLYELIGRVKNCLLGAALATGTQIEINIDEMIYASFKPNYALSDLFRQNLKIFNIAEIKTSETENIASTDVGNVSQITPTIHPSLAICGPEIAVHSPEFAQSAISDFAHERMLTAAKTMAMTAYDLIFEPQNLAAVKKEFHV